MISYVCHPPQVQEVSRLSVAPKIQKNRIGWGFVIISVLLSPFLNRLDWDHLTLLKGIGVITSYLLLLIFGEVLLEHLMSGNGLQLLDALTKALSWQLLTICLLFSAAWVASRWALSNSIFNGLPSWLRVVLAVSPAIAIIVFLIWRRPAFLVFRNEDERT